MKKWHTLTHVEQGRSFDGGPKMRNLKLCVYKYNENGQTTVNDIELTKKDVCTFSLK
jgi:hypothetical protein